VQRSICRGPRSSRGGNTATIAAFARALDALGAERGLDAILVGAMDSWLVEPRLSALLEQKLARAEGELARSRRGALVPSEAAVFVLLERERTAHAAGRRALAAIVASELTRRAEKDAAAPLLAATLGKLGAGTPRAWLINDVNGESRRADTWSAAARDARDASGSIRMATILEEVSSPARDVGDAGAATGALGVALAATLFGAGAGPEEAAIVGVYDAGAVGGLLLERAGEPDRSAAQPAAPSSAGSSELALTFRVLESALRSFRAVEHRLHPARRSPILDATFALGTRLAALEDEEFPAVDLFDAVDLTCRELGVACERANRSEERRGRAAEPTVKDLERLGREIAEVVRELRVSSPEPPEEVTTPPPGPVPTLVSRGVPFELPIPFTAIPRAPKASAPEQEVDFEDELEEEPGSSQAGAALPPPPAPPEPKGPHVATAVECLDSIARLWPLRTPRSDGRWTRALKDVEARLLTQLDLLFALSEPFDTKPAPPLLRDEALDLLPLVRRSESSMEPGRTFADTLVLACARDPRLVRAAVWGARGVSVDLYEAYADALALGVSPHVDDALAELCLEDDERTLSLALDVAWRRRAVTVGPVLTCLYHASPAIRLRAARALGASHHPEAAAKALDARLAVERSPSVIAAILESMVRLHAPHADEHVHRALVELVRLGAEVDDEHREARLTLGKLSAAIGRVHDVNVFVGASTHAREIECLGWFGRATVLGPLVDTLAARAKDDGIPQACARALARITGLVPESTPRGPRLVDGKLTTVDDERLLLDPNLWRAHCAAHGELLSASSKLRFGRNFSVGEAITEHLADGVRVRDRAFTSVEIAFNAQRAFTALDESGWVEPQLAALGRSS
jgi:hypothetical protein